LGGEDYGETDSQKQKSAKRLRGIGDLRTPRQIVGGVYRAGLGTG